MLDFNNTEIAFSSKSRGELQNAYWLFNTIKYPNYKYLSDFDKRNAFDVERYMSTRPAIVKPDEAFDIYEIDLSDEDAAAEE